MGFFSGLFGGGKTTVTQTAQQATTVNTDVAVTNDISVSTAEIAKVLEAFGGKVSELSEGTKSVIEKLLGGQLQQNEIGKVGIFSQLLGIEAQAAQTGAIENQTDLIRRRTKQAGILIVGGLAFWYWRKSKRKKKK